MSMRKVLTSTTSLSVAPAAARISLMFSSTARVCARMSSTARPLASVLAPAMESSARRALVPEMKMKSPARRKWGKVPRGLALPGSTALCGISFMLPCIPYASQLYADIHGFREEGERVHPSFAADSRELHAAEGRAQIPQEPVIHPGDADLHLPRHPMRALEVGGPHRRRKPVTRVVGELHRLLLGVERRHVADRAEDLLLYAARILAKSADDGGLDECALVALIAESGHAAPAQDLALLGAREAVVGEHLVAMTARDERAHVGSFVGTTDLQGARPLHQRLDEALEYGTLDVHPLGAQTDLAAVREHRAHRSGKRGFEVRICKHQ